MASVPQIVTNRDVTISAPDAAFIQFDASSSRSFDYSPLQFTWNVTNSSPASYKIYKETNHEAIFGLLNVGVGRYVFNLTVRDGQGQSSSTAVTLQVTDDDNINNLVEIVIPSCRMMTKEERDDASDELLIDLKQHAEVVEISSIFQLYQTDDLVMLILAYDESNNVLNASSVVPILRSTLELTGFKSFCQSGRSGLPRVAPYICTEQCDGHGTCSNATKMCECDPFWVSSPFGHVTNCAWSVVYVAVVTIVLLLTFVGLGYLFRHVRTKKLSRGRKWKKRRNQLNYNQLQDESNSDAEYAEFHRARRKRRVRRQKQRNSSNSDRIDLLKAGDEVTNSDHNSSQSDTIFDASSTIKEDIL